MLVLQLILYCLLFTGIVKLAVIDGAVNGLFFYPKNVQERAIELGLTDRATIDRRFKRFMTIFYVGMAAALIGIIGIWNRVDGTAFCTGNRLSLPAFAAQPFQKPFCKPFFDQLIGNKAEGGADCKRKHDAKQGARRADAEIEYLSIQKGYRIVMEQIKGKADVSQTHERCGKTAAQFQYKKGKHQSDGGQSPDKQPAEAENVDGRLCRKERHKQTYDEENDCGGHDARQLFCVQEAIQSPCGVIAKDTEDKFQHDRIAVKGKKHAGGRKKLRRRDDTRQQTGADKTAQAVADPQGKPEQHIKEKLTVDRPADTHQRLDDTAPYIKGNKQHAFDKKDRLRSADGKLTRENEQQKEGACCHKLVQRQNADQPSDEEMRGAFVRGKHNHKAADAEKDVDAESAAV